MIVLAVDPGAPGKTAGTGIVLVDGDALSGWKVVRAARRPAAAPDVPYLAEVLLALDELAAAGPYPQLLAVEQASRPRGHTKHRTGHLIDPTWLLVAAAVAGAAAAWARWNDLPLVEVPAGDHGGAIPQAYPPAIRSGRRHIHRHARSAWDVAMAARTLARSGLHRWEERAHE